MKAGRQRAISFCLSPLLAGLIPGAGEARPSPVESQRVVAELRVHGNYSVPDAEVVRIAQVAVGDPLPPGAIADIERRLLASGRFDRVEGRVRYRTLSATSEVALVLVVHERPQATPANPVARSLRGLRDRYLFVPLVSYAEGYGFTYGVRSTFVDIGGDQGRLSVPATWGGTKRLAVEWARGLDRGPLGIVQAGVGMRRETNPHFDRRDERVRSWLRLDSREFRRMRVGTEVGWTDIRFAGADERFTTTGVDLTVDTRVTPTFPRDAIFLKVGWTALHVNGRAGAVARTSLDLRAFKGLSGQSVLAVRTSFEGASQSVPDYEQPMLGGAATLRGSKTGTFAGDQRLATSVEYRLPLSSPLSVGRVGLTLFYDTGAAYAANRPATSARFHHGTGIGMFASAPLFELRLDVGHNLAGQVRVHVGGGLSF